MIHTIYFAMEFHGTGDPCFGGSAADWALYKTEDGGQAFIAAADAQRRKLVKSYFPTYGGGEGRNRSEYPEGADFRPLRQTPD